MNTLNQEPQVLTLTVRKDHKLIVLNKTVTTAARITSKAVIAAVVLTLLNLII